jgi:hypothetical protein
MDVCLLWVLCVVRYRSLRRADHSSRGVLSSVVCLKCVIVKPRKMRRPRPPRGCRAIGKKKYFYRLQNTRKCDFFLAVRSISNYPRTWMESPRIQFVGWGQFTGTDLDNVIQRTFSPWMWLIRQTKPINWSTTPAVRNCIVKRLLGTARARWVAEQHKAK